VTTSAVSRWEADRRRIPELAARFLTLIVDLELKLKPRRR
jgi:hypothetical protein